MNIRFLSLSLALALLASCGGGVSEDISSDDREIGGREVEDGKPEDQEPEDREENPDEPSPGGEGSDTLSYHDIDVTLTLRADGFSPTWSSGTEMNVWQVCDGVAGASRKAVIVNTPSGPTLNARFEGSASTDVFYAVCGPGRAVSEDGVCSLQAVQTSMAGIPYPDCDIVMGRSTADGSFNASDTVRAVSVPMNRYGGVVLLDIDGMIQGDAIRSVSLTFPSPVCGFSTFDPSRTVMSVENATSSNTIGANTTVTRKIVLRTFPFKLPAGASIGVSVTSSLTSYNGSVTLGEAFEASDGDTLTLSCNFKSTARLFRNPVIGKSFADPTIWRDGNTFYATATGLGSTMKSTDLVSWTGMGGGPYSSGAKSAAQAIGKDLWAPDMIRIGDKWMLYISCVDSGVRNVIGVASSKNIAKGAWQWEGIVTDSNVSGISATIDPEVVADPQTGKLWLFFGSTKKIWRVELNEQGTGLAPGAKYVHVAGKNIDKSNDPHRQTVFEGAYLHRHGNYWYLFVSAGQYAADNYKVLVGRSETLDGVFLDRQGRNMTQGVGTRVLYSDAKDRFYGPGHNGEIFTDKTGQDYILYHCHDSSTGTETRFLFLQRLFWDSEGWPFMETGKPLEEDVAPVF